MGGVAAQTEIGQVEAPVGKYKIVMSKDDKLCNYMREVLDGDLKVDKQGVPHQSYSHSVFSAIQWKKHGRYDSDNTYDYGGWYTKIDIDNDNQVETVIRRNVAVSRSNYDNIFVIDPDHNRTDYKTLEDLKQGAEGGIVFGRSGYDYVFLSPRTYKDGPLKGKQYREGLSQYVRIYPFLFERNYYLLIHSNALGDYSADGAVRTLVTRYIKGFVRAADREKLEDLCYLDSYKH